MPASSLHQLSNDGDLIDARVAELDFSSSWFENTTHFEMNAPCSLPPRQLPTFGLGYQSVSEEMKTVSCWVSHQHRQAGNLDVDTLIQRGAELVHGSGVSELLIASIVTSAKMFEMEGLHRKPVVTMHIAPYYSILKMHLQSHLLRGVVDWMEPDNVSVGSLDGRPLIVIAITPTNPGGSLDEGILADCHDQDGALNCFGSPAQIIADHSFLWPCTVHPLQRATGHSKWPVTPKRESALLFGLSKLTGHSGVRYGWAWIPNSTFASTMRQTLWEMGLTLSAASLSHAALVLASVSQRSAQTKESFHGWCAAKMDFRWSQLRALPMFDNGSCFELRSQQRSAFTVVHCKQHTSCAEYFQSHGILVSKGEQFGMTSSEVRIALGLDDSLFRRLVVQLNAIKKC